MEWNLEPMGGVDPQMVPPNAPPTPMRAWGQWFGNAAQAAAPMVQQAGEGLRQVQAMDPAEVVDGKEAQRQLRMERARQSYEWRFGSPVQGRRDMASLSSQGQQSQIDELLRRVHFARQQGYRPGG